VNYYEHHIGDYAQATGHLSMLEDAAYSRMIRWYYAKERPLPPDVKAVCRLVRATTRHEVEAVRAVLAEFFELREDGYHQVRCDEEIAKFAAGGPEREAKAANETNRLRRHREERAALFKALTDAGQHAPWNIGINELRELVKRCGPPLPATAPATLATATQTPDTRHQTPEAIPSVGVPTGAAAPRPTPPPSLVALESAEARPLTAKERVWSLGVPLLGEAQRPHLGKLAKTYGEEVLAAVLADATLERPVDPKAWVIAACERRRTASPARVNGHHEPVDLLADPKPQWALDAGFATRFEAENAGCYRHNAASFRGGKRTTQA
jgi:uncharacterized protein YdaU (DUF1376 family)